MTFPSTASAPASSYASSLRVSTHALVLDEITGVGVNACLWRRPLDRASGAELRALAAREPSLDLEQEIDVHAVPRVELPVGGARARIEADLAALVPVFARLSGRRHLKLRIASTRDDACRKFHVDWVGLRLLVTYAGPGTEMVAAEHARREQVGRHDLGFAEANAAIVPDVSRIVRAEAGDVVLLKGEAWRGNEGRGAIHRSPPIEAVRASRLVLKLDATACGC